MLASSPEDRVASASLYGRDQADLILGLDRFKAMVTAPGGPTGSRQTEALVLDDWWSAPIPGQLAGLQQAARTHTLPKREVVRVNNTRYWDRLDAAGAQKRAAADARRPQSVPPSKPKRSTGQTPPPRPGPLQSRPRPAPPASDDSPRQSDPAGPGSPALLDGPPDF